MKDLWTYLKEQNRPIVLYGMGDGAEKVISALNRYSLKPAGVFASDGFVRDKYFCGLKVTDYKTAACTFPDMIVLLCFGTALDGVIENVKKIAEKSELYAPDVPVYGGELFNAEYYFENAESIKKVRELLFDGQSKKCFDNVVKYKLTGDINLLFDCQTPSDEPYKSFLKLTDCESFLDLGAYRGDTVAEFLSQVGGYEAIAAVEPDKKSFSKLKAATENLKNVTLFNAAAGEKDGTVLFDAQHSRGSSVGEGEAIPSISVDGIKGFTPSFIKFDVEGAELSAIKGAEKTIEKYRPKLQIAAYHKSEDIIKIPLEILKINPSYKVFMRHFPCLPAWDTNYYFI